jgi:hypothetical protein
LGIPISVTKVPDVFHVLELQRNIQNSSKPSPDVYDIGALEKKMERSFRVCHAKGAHGRKGAASGSEVLISWQLLMH